MLFEHGRRRRHRHRRGPGKALILSSHYLVTPATCAVAVCGGKADCSDNMIEDTTTYLHLKNPLQADLQQIYGPLNEHRRVLELAKDNILPFALYALARKIPRCLNSEGTHFY